jgi:hypothetical protein
MRKSLLVFLTALFVSNTALAPPLGTGDRYTRKVLDDAVEIVPIVLIGYGYTNDDLLSSYARYSDLSNQLGGARVTYTRIYVNLLNVRSEEALNSVVDTLINRLRVLSPRYVIVDNLTAMSSALTEVLKVDFPKTHFTLGWTDTDSIQFVPDFTTLFSFLSDADYTDGLNIVYLSNVYNVSNTEDVKYMEALSTAKAKFNFTLNQTKIKTAKDLRKFLLDINKREDTVLIVSNLHYLVNEVFSKVRGIDYVQSELGTYNLNSLILSLSYESYLSYYWSRKDLAEYLDALILANYFSLLDTQPTQKIQPKLTIDVMELSNRGVFTGISLSDLRRLLSR